MAADCSQCGGVVKHESDCPTLSLVGSIWYTSWGYDQTNVEFFEVVRETDASLVLRRITCEARDGRVWPHPGDYTIDYNLMGNSERFNRETREWEPNPPYVRDKERGFSEKVCRKGRYGSVKIDNVRRAYPYEGGGKYETFAAGGMGH